jgi:hypothetical protein
MKTGRVLSCKANGGRENLDPLQSVSQRGYASTILQRSQGEEITKAFLYCASWQHQNGFQTTITVGLDIQKLNMVLNEHYKDQDRPVLLAICLAFLSLEESN